MKKGGKVFEIFVSWGWNSPVVKWFHRPSMYHEPEQGDYFRIGPFTGECLGKTKNWVFMLVRK
jgi:hypothetical protein